MNPLRVVLVDFDEDLFDIAPSVRDAMVAIIAAAGGELTIGQWRTPVDAHREAENAAVLMIQSIRPLVNADLIAGLTQCRGIIRLGLGYDSVDVAAATAAGIPVSNVVNWCDAEVAEHALALILAAIRRLPAHDRSMRTGAWERQVARGAARLQGKTVGLIGFGGVGRAVAARLQGFGVHLLVFDPATTAEEVASRGGELVPFDQLLATADLISVHARLHAGNRHLLGVKELAACKPGAFLINTSRGPLIDEAALVDALRGGRLAGAALDVMELEPLPADSPLRQLDSVLLTSHVASYSAEAVSELYLRAAGIAAEFLAGRRPKTVVNPDVWSRAEAHQAGNR